MITPKLIQLIMIIVLPIYILYTDILRTQWTRRIFYLTFQAVNKSTNSADLFNQRMSRAEHLPANTDCRSVRFRKLPVTKMRVAWRKPSGKIQDYCLTNTIISPVKIDKYMIRDKYCLSKGECYGLENGKK